MDCYYHCFHCLWTTTSSSDGGVTTTTTTCSFSLCESNKFSNHR